MSTSTEQHADPLPMVTILQRGIRQALMDEAMEWTGDARVEVWMALIGAGNRMGIVITKGQLYGMQRERKQMREQQAEATPPVCPRCHNNRQVWINQISGRWKCHRAYCDTEINTEVDRPQSGRTQS